MRWAVLLAILTGSSTATSPGGSCSVDSECQGSTGASLIRCISQTCQIIQCDDPLLYIPIKQGTACDFPPALGSKCFPGDRPCREDNGYLSTVEARLIDCVDGTCQIVQCQDALSQVPVERGTSCSAKKPSSAPALSLIGGPCQGLEGCNTNEVYLNPLNVKEVVCSLGTCIIAECKNLDVFTLSSDNLHCVLLQPVGNSCNSDSDCNQSLTYLSSLKDAVQIGCDTICKIKQCSNPKQPSSNGKACVAIAVPAQAEFASDSCSGQAISVTNSVSAIDCLQLQPSFPCQPGTTSILPVCVPNIDNYAKSQFSLQAYFSDGGTPLSFWLLNTCWKTNTGSEMYIYNPNINYTQQIIFSDPLCTLASKTGSRFNFKSPSLAQLYNLNSIASIGSKCTSQCDLSLYFSGTVTSIGCFGVCQIQECAIGYILNAEQTTCIPKPSSTLITTSSIILMSSTTFTSSTSALLTTTTTTSVTTSTSSSRVITSTSPISTSPTPISNITLPDIDKYLLSLQNLGPPSSSPPMSWISSDASKLFQDLLALAAKSDLDPVVFSNSTIRGSLGQGSPFQRISGGPIISSTSLDSIFILVVIDSVTFTFGSVFDQTLVLSNAVNYTISSSRLEFNFQIPGSSTNTWYTYYFPTESKFAIGLYSNSHYIGNLVTSVSGFTPSSSIVFTQGYTTNVLLALNLDGFLKGPQVFSTQQMWILPLLPKK
ncbi:hypothetical protein BC830DRAFT_434041 [Chytriomyces sp. MP71]|nr:hypothetical protein BC830DRAFT_434041 [Chytriomyces sp. MP71]